MVVYVSQDIMELLHGEQSSESRLPSDIAGKINEVNKVVKSFEQQDDSVERPVPAGAIPILVKHLKGQRYDVPNELQTAALQALLVVARSGRSNSAAIADAGAIPYLLDFTSSQDVFLTHIALNVLYSMTNQLGVNSMFPLSNRLEVLLKAASKDYVSELSLTLVNCLLSEMSVSEKDFKMCIETLSNLPLNTPDVTLVNAVLRCLVLLSKYAKKPLGTYLLDQQVMTVIAQVVYNYSEVGNYEQTKIAGLGRCLFRLFKIDKRLITAAQDAGLLEALDKLASTMASVNHYTEQDASEKDEAKAMEITEVFEAVQCEVSWALAAVIVHCEETTIARILYKGRSSPLWFHRGRSNEEYRLAVSLMSRVLSLSGLAEKFMRDHVLPSLELQRTDCRSLASFLNALKTSLKEVKRGPGLDEVASMMEISGCRNELLRIERESSLHNRRVAREILDLIR